MIDTYNAGKDSIQNVLKIARVVTVPIAFVHIRAFVTFMKNQGAEVTLISSDENFKDVIERSGLKIKTLEIPRKIRIFKDIRALWSLFFLFKKERFDIIHSSTPKAGLLVAIAGFFSNDKSVVLHTFTGQRWATMTGLYRKIFKLLDKLIIKLNRRCYADSRSQVNFLISEDVALENEVKVIHHGSYGGIDIHKFDNLKYPDARVNILKRLGLENDSILCLFVGRVTKDKGIEELIKSISMAQKTVERLVLLIVGPFEPELDPIDPEVLALLKSSSFIYTVGYTNAPEEYFSGCDFFCLPSYREGFGTVVLEAAACGIPTIGTKIPGLIDSIQDGVTGVLIPKQSITELTDAIIRFSIDVPFRESLGRNAKQRAIQDFDSNFLAELHWREYLQLIKK